MKKILLLSFLVISLLNLNAQNQKWSEKLAATIMQLWPDSLSFGGKPAKWTYDQGLFLKGIENIWKRTGDGKYFSYIQKSMDFFVQNDATIRTYKQTEYNIDNILPGRNLLLLYQVTEKEKYKKAADLLREQLKGQPRTQEGGFWHKKRYPFQMWLDGLYMGEPFYAEYAKLYNESAAFDDIANQFIWMEKNSRDAKTGLLYHAWNENKEEKWANKTTGCSPHFWGRAMGWYGMALVDALEYFPINHPKRQLVIDILNRYVTAISKVQDKKSGVWYQILDMAGKKGNYLEASASCMFVYAMAKGVRMGYLDEKVMETAKKGYEGILKTFISTDNKGISHLNRVCQVAGLGGSPYRDGTYKYYINEPIITDDPKGLGAFLHTAVEMEIYEEQLSKKPTVTLDYYFNNERRKTKEGQPYRFHYIWEELDLNGFSLLGNLFTDFGAKINSLEQAPDAQNLKNSDIYIIVDPDGLKDNEKPNYIAADHVKAISDWVNDGGVLVLMTNDSVNCDLVHFNQLANHFGINYTFKSRNMVKGTEFETGAVYIPANHEVFKQAKKLYLKEISIIETKAPAVPLISKNGETIIATAKYGKGTVFAVGDPWLYNEYIDGRKLPADFENFKAAKDLVKWLLAQSRK